MSRAGPGGGAPVEDDPPAAGEAPPQLPVTEDKASGTTSASIAMFLAPLVAALALFTVTGAIGRVQRDHPELFTAAIAFVLIAGALLVLASSENVEAAKRNRYLRIASSVFVIVGFTLAIGLTIETADDAPRPRISAALDEDRHDLEATVTASNLTTSQRIAIEVDALKRDVGDTADFIGGERIYRAYVGPDSDGNVTHELDVPIPRGEFTDVGVKAFTGSTATPCGLEPSIALRRDTDYGAGTACVTIALVPVVTVPPQPVGGR